MSLHRFLADDVSADTIVLAGEEARHAARALRVTVGERVSVGDGRGAVVSGPVTSVDPDRVEIAVEERRAVPRPVPAITVCPAVPKAGKLDLVVQKLTELGVPSIAPWVAERSVARWDGRKRAANVVRWEAIARSAAKQARLAWVPSVRFWDDFSEMSGPGVLCHEGAAARLSQRLPAEPVEAFVLVTGPEGGLTDTEVARAEAAGLATVSLGEPILRAETAAIIAAALVMGAMNLLG